MTCSCDFDSEPEFFKISIRLARNSHRCTECKRIIKSGEKYHYIRGKWDGDFSVYKRCFECEDLASTLKDIRCFCDVFGQLSDNVVDELNELKYSANGDYFYVMRKIVAVKRKRSEA